MSRISLATHSSRRVAAALGSLFLAATVLTACGDDNPSRSADPEAPSISVSGTGEVQGVPDTLTATVGVETTAADVSGAIAAAGQRVNAVTAAVVKAGVARADVTTQQVSLTPQYAGVTPGGAQSISGYQATNSLRITVRKLDTASTVLGDAVAAGGNDSRLSGVAFRIDDDSKLITDARARAFADARDRADQYAGLAKRKLGRVLSISENISGQTQPLDARSSQASTAIPIEPGSQTVTVSVSVKWQLD
ncbi:SIMPL domain-containing protein [Williamsia sp. CHRR-6]|uniref:SIMPL domain-containing protein n=1 Tax=Williamsia sp. CHRR-6 TaxID=2835871 RepID=UPI001BD9AFAC|nr:SIMPL domain-containing protein [Williamsia sp. CHRR-6]MBT0566696.1 SIMPL domain-containing protein [Williamsia sp. CHRR-6]